MSLQSDPQQATRRELLLSIVVPVFNERTMLPVFLENLLPILQSLALKSEVVFVDDGSQDGSAEYLRQMISKMPGIKLLKLSRNFGKEAALTAGLDYAVGRAVVLLDADLQDPPECIPEMLARWREGADVVLMQRRDRAGESWSKRASAYLYYRLLRRLARVPIPTDSGDFRLMSRRAVEAVRRLDERNRYMKGLFAWVGLPTVVCEYHRAPRPAGNSKWSYPRLLGLALEGITSFSVAPLRWATMAGVVAALLGGGYGAVIVVKALLFGEAVQGYPSLVALITFLGGLQLLTIGLVGEYVGKTYLEAKRRPIYLVRDVVKPVSPGGEQRQSTREALAHAHVR